MTDITKMKLNTASSSQSPSPSLPWPLIITWWPQIALQWCTFKHADTMCEIEWKRTPYNVTMGQCDDYEGRVEFKVSSVQPLEEEKKHLENSSKLLDAICDEFLCRATTTSTSVVYLWLRQPLKMTASGNVTLSPTSRWFFLSFFRGILLHYLLGGLLHHFLFAWVFPLLRVIISQLVCSGRKPRERIQSCR